MQIEEQWLCYRVVVAQEDVEIASNWLLEMGCEGVQIEDTAIVFDESEDATLVTSQSATLTGYRRGEAAQAADLLAHERAFSGELQVEPVVTQDWANQWKENFPPLEIGPFLVVPTWVEDVSTEKTVLRLDPGLAFGTGQHPTTRMCLELLPEAIAGRAGVRVLDVGCGSGILSLAAAKLGATVVASDLDAWCTQATQENARLNGVEVEVHLVADMDWVTSPFPVVVANLMSDLLIRLAPDFARVTAAGGTLLVSGISAPRADEVEAALQAAGFETRLARQMDGDKRGDGESAYQERWAAFLFQRKADN